MIKFTRSFLALAVTLPALTVNAAKPSPAELPGIYDGVHPHWRDTVIISHDGTYRRGNGDPGTWTFDGKTLSLNWKNWGVEPVQQVGPGKFINKGGFSLTKRPLPEWIYGTYDATHPHWRAPLTLRPDGTVKNEKNGSVEKWSFDGNTLCFHWSGYGDEPVQLQSPGVFSNAGGFKLNKQGGVAVAVAPPPAPVVRDCGTGNDDPGCQLSKNGCFPMDKTEFEGLMTVLKGQRNELIRKEMALGTLEKSCVTAKQFGQIIALFANELNRMEVVTERASKMVNPKHALVFATTFRNSINAREYTEHINGLE